MHVLEFLWFSMNAPLWAILAEILQAPKGSGDPGGFCSQSESKEGGGKRKQREKGTFFHGCWTLLACSNRDSHSVEAGVKCHVGVLCSFAVWIQYEFSSCQSAFFLWTKCYVLLNLFLFFFFFFVRTNNSSSNCVAWKESSGIMHSCICALTSHLRKFFDIYFIYLKVLFWTTQVPLKEPILKTSYKSKCIFMTDITDWPTKLNDLLLCSLTNSSTT